MNKLKELSLRELEELYEEVYDKWTWETGSEEDKKLLQTIKTRILLLQTEGVGGNITISCGSSGSCGSGGAVTITGSYGGSKNG